MKRADIEAYTGVDKPPYCEMTLRAADGSTPPDLILPVTLTGVKQPTTITLERVAETIDGVVGPPHTLLAKSPGNYKCYFSHKVGACAGRLRYLICVSFRPAHVVPEAVFISICTN